MGGADAVEIVLTLIFLAAWAAVVVVNFLKGKVVFGLISLLGGWLGLVGAIRLAKPKSAWARRYDRDKMARSMARFPSQARTIDPHWATNLRADRSRPRFASAGDWPDEDPALWDKITRRAYKKEHGHWPEQAQAAAAEEPPPGS